jgi:hypothetical protein
LSCLGDATCLSCEIPRYAFVPGTVWGTAPMQNLPVVRGAVLAPQVWQALDALPRRPMPPHVVTKTPRRSIGPTQLSAGPTLVGAIAPPAVGPPRARSSKTTLGAVYVRIPTAIDRRRTVRRNPRKPAYCETGHRPISGEYLV